VLVGPNGSGKTSVLQALHLLSQLGMDNARQLFQDDMLPENLSTRGTQEFQIECTEQFSKLPGRILIYSYKREDNESWGFINRQSEIASESKDQDPYELHIAEQKYVDQSEFNAIYLTLSASQIAQPSYTEAILPQMQNDGSHIASMLAHLMTYEPDTFQKLVSLTKRIIPTIRRIRAQRTHIQLQEERIITIDGQKTSIPNNRVVIGDELVFDMLSGDTIPAHSVSEGTLITLGILAALISVDGPMVLLLDDIERGIHPWAQRMLMDVLKELLEEQDDLQIILTTHSPYIVDEVEASDVWVFNLDDEGFVQSALLSDHPYAERALEVLTTGEFLSAEGEEWVGQINSAEIESSDA